MLELIFALLLIISYFFGKRKTIKRPSKDELLLKKIEKSLDKFNTLLEEHLGKNKKEEKMKEKEESSLEEENDFTEIMSSYAEQINKKLNENKGDSKFYSSFARSFQNLVKPYMENGEMGEAYNNLISGMMNLANHEGNPYKEDMKNLMNSFVNTSE